LPIVRAKPFIFWSSHPAEKESYPSHFARRHAGILWLPASFFNLAFIPPCYRVLYVNVVFFFWTIILSMMVNTSEPNSS
jgi:hypothetical protein